MGSKPCLGINRSFLGHEWRSHRLWSGVGATRILSTMTSTKLVETREKYGIPDHIRLLELEAHERACYLRPSCVTVNFCLWQVCLYLCTHFLGWYRGPICWLPPNYCQKGGVNWLGCTSFGRRHCLGRIFPLSSKLFSNLKYLGKRSIRDGIIWLLGGPCPFHSGSTIF